MFCFLWWVTVAETPAGVYGSIVLNFSENLDTRFCIDVMGSKLVFPAWMNPRALQEFK